MASINKPCILLISCMFSMLAFVKLADSKLVNIARDKPAAMSSVSEGSSPDFAVDGNETEDSMCSLTNSSIVGDQWWRLNLTESRLVRQIHIHLTPQYLIDDFLDTQVYITNVPVPDNTRDPCQVITGSDNTTDSPDVMKLECDMEGRYVFILRRDFQENTTELFPPQLVLCEVFVFVCTDGMYGSNCSLTCGQCRDDDCHSVSGVCPGSCRDGYIGKRCDTVCQNDSYGPNCSLTCGQCGISGCDHVTGSCNGGCKDGYTGNLCQKSLAQADTGLSPLAAGGIGAVVAFVATVILVAVIIFLICCYMTREKKMETDTPVVGVNAVRYGRKNEEYQEDEEHNNTNSLDRNQYEEFDESFFQPISMNGSIPTVILTPTDDAETTTSSSDPHYLCMSATNQNLYEDMGGHVTSSDPDDVVDPEAVEIPEPSILEKSLGGNSYINMSEANAYGNTQM